MERTHYHTKNTKGHHSVKTKSRVMFFFSAHHLMVLCICTKIHELTLNGFRDVERTQNAIF